MRQKDDRRAGALRSEGREGQRVAVLGERGDREQLGGRDDALPAAPVDPNLVHVFMVGPAPPRAHQRARGVVVGSSPRRRSAIAPATDDRLAGLTRRRARAAASTDAVYAPPVSAKGLDREIDRLYGLPLGEFTAERDALARRLRGDGQRDEAAEVGGLRKPVLAAWVVNRLARERRNDVRALVAAAAAIRAGKPEADERFRAAADDLVRAGRKLLVAEGARPRTPSFATSATTLRSAAAADPELLTGGRLTEPVEATGFEAMAGAVAPAKRPARARAREDTKAEKARVDEARAALTAARDEARKLGREADRAEREARRSRAAAEAAERHVAEAEGRLARLRPSGA